MLLRLTLFSLVVALFPLLLSSQTCRDASVELTAEIQDFPPRITLNWVANPTASQHFVYRKLKTEDEWGSVLATLPDSATQFIDTTVSSGVSYEYRVSRTAVDYSGVGYINSGINIPPVESRGILILVVDSTIVDSLAFEISRLIDDLEGDGWIILQRNVPRNAPVTQVKAQIISAFQMHPGIPKTCFLLGHVPVPYSGNLNPDAHPDHLGAWPADVYYGDVNGIWTDLSVNNTLATGERNDNVPGDGKFDQSTLTSDVDMPVGRVDFANMPAFAMSEIQLLRNYLDKNHRYRHRDFEVTRKMLIDDNFGFFSGEAFAANGWKATPLVGMDNVEEGDYFTDLSTKSFLWSYGCGGGSYTSAGGIGTTEDFAASYLNSVFTILFGSYFGDWDSPNNFLRAPLAQGTTLTNVWAGRPHWAFHHMGLGETIGYSTRISQNNNGLYFASFSASGVHMALMGDPTLRNDIVSPVSDVQANLIGTDAHISWIASPDDILGYHIYQRREGQEAYALVHQEPITATSFVDTCVLQPGVYSYMVRALVLERSPSGTYFNLSQGITDTVLNTNDLEVIASASWISASGNVYFNNTSVNSTTYHWDFGDGETNDEEHPVHVFGDGDYTVTLIASNTCDADTVTFEISVSTAIQDFSEMQRAVISPNPGDGVFTIDTEESIKEVLVYDSRGTLVSKITSADSINEFTLEEQPAGMYLILLTTNASRFARKVLLQR